MKRYLLLMLPVFLVCAIAWADGPIPSPETERALRLQRNLELVQALVDGSLQLAGEDDPLKRANYCSGMAEQLSKEIERATEGRDAPRVTELGKHLKAMLETGVATNLNLARSGIPQGSVGEKKLFEVGIKASQTVDRLEEHLQKMVKLEPETQAEMQQALDGMVEGREQIEKAVKPTSKPRDKSKPKSNKGN